MNNLETGKFELLTTPLNIINGIDDLAPVQPNADADNTPFISIDSFKLRMLFDKNKMRSYPDYFDCIITKELKNLTTGEVQLLNETSAKNIAKSFSNDNNITGLFIGIEIINAGEGFKPHFTFKITSKLLKEDYYTGITAANIGKIIDYIRSVGFDFLDEDFYDAEITDIDYKFDYTLSTDEYKTLKTTYMEMAKLYKELNRGITPFRKKSNTGLQFGNRKTANYGYPFFKIYNKEKELKNKKTSIPFANTYIPTIIKDLYRWELTIKDKKHFEHLELGNRLRNHLQLVQNDQPILMNVFKKYHYIHLNINKSSNRATIQKNFTDMNGIDKSMIIELLINKGLGYNAIIDHFKRAYANLNRQTEYNHIKKVMALYEDLKADNLLKVKIEKNEIADKLFNLIGIYSS